VSCSTLCGNALLIGVVSARGSKYCFKKKSCEVPQSKSLSPTSDLIISSVCEHYGVSFNELLMTRRGIFNEPRKAAYYEEFRDLKNMTEKLKNR